ncbi:MAG TPA: TetR/AcrR family transcriptional regulator [Smithellaceae bacterium]|nr:TetR/AcrR family transcriptional regulator [Smithellaceae bacterium]HRS83342.1 TetR/AcrR family transcriptional regulator [Smithellaceae bacterium]
MMNHTGTDCRRQILDASLPLFARKGYAATSVREILDAAGITAPTLYYYFGNKEGLYLNLMQTHCAMIDEALSAYTDDAVGATQRLKNLVDKIFQLVIEDKDFFRLMFADYYGPSESAPYCDYISCHVKFHAAIRKILEEGMRSGEFQPGNAGHMTWMIRGVVQLAMEEQIKEDREKIDRKGLQSILDLILDRLSRPSKADATVHSERKSFQGG